MDESTPEARQKPDHLLRDSARTNFRQGMIMTEATPTTKEHSCDGPPGSLLGRWKHCGGAYTCRQLSGGSNCVHGDNSFSYTHTHTHTHMYTHNIHIHTHIHICIYTTHTCAYTTYTTYTHIHMCTQTTHTHTRMYIHNTHMYVDNLYTRIHTCTYTTHTHIHICT